MKMYTRRIDQGQAVEVSYGYGYDGTAYCRTHDRSDGSVVWQRGVIDWDREPEGVDYDRVPCVESWERCDSPRDES
jgi:hypothetical protein